MVQLIHKGSNSKIRYFMACCIKGGLNSKEQILIAKKWALENNILEKIILKLSNVMFLLKKFQMNSKQPIIVNGK